MQATSDDAETPLNDAPITSSEQDRLDRTLAAEDLARTIRNIDASDGVVAAVVGAWGHGKSSFINLMRGSFATTPAIPVIDFNPWMFSGTQQLVDVFFSELSAEMKLKDPKFEQITRLLDNYADFLSPLGAIPFAGPWWDRSRKALSAFRAWQKNRAGGVRSIRDQIRTALTDLPGPIVVVVDDIDRLTTQEIRDIFRLVRLTASFPNIIYLLSFDRDRVEQALREDNLPGRQYLEKIVQVSFDLPAITEPHLREATVSALDRVLAGVNGLVDQTRWPDVYWEIMHPLVGNMRDVNRLALSCGVTIHALGGQVDLVDLLALEAVRVFRPELFQRLTGLRSQLTAIGSTRDDPNSKEQVEALLAKLPDDADLIKSMIRRIFPAAKRYIDNFVYGETQRTEWRRAHRIAHIDFLELYLDRVAPTGLAAFRAAEIAFTHLTDAAALDTYLRSLDPSTLEDTIMGIADYEPAFVEEMVVPTSVILLNLIPSIPDRVRGMFDWLTPEVAVRRVVIQMLGKIDEQPNREQFVEQIIARVPSLSGRLALLEFTAGSRELVSPEFTRDAETALFEEVARTTTWDVENEWQLVRLFFLLHERTSDAPLSDNRDPELTGTILIQASSEARSQYDNSRVVTRKPRLAWDLLVGIYGSEANLAEAVDAIRGADKWGDVVELHDKYASGWRDDTDHVD